MIAAVAVVLLREPGASGPAASPTPSETPVLTAATVLSESDVASLDPKATWQTALSQDVVDANTPRPTCLTLDAEGVPLARSTQVQSLQRQDDANSSVLHLAFEFTSAADATSAAGLWTTQLGTCDRPVSYLASGWDISGVGDEAAGVTAAVQDTTVINHVVMLSRSGPVVHVLDVSAPKNVPDVKKTTAILGAAVDRTCGPAEATCSSSPGAKATVPPKTADNPEFLADADIPRITPGAGRWGGTDVATSFDFYGSQCEGKDLATVNGPKERKHRAFLLQEDSKAPETFGIDEFILTYDKKNGADGLVKDISSSIDGCGKAMLTASVDKGDNISVTAADGKTKITGRTWTVTQQVNETTKQTYRIALVQADAKVIFTLLPTTQGFDFSNGQWKAIAERAGLRAQRG